MNSIDMSGFRSALTRAFAENGIAKYLSYEKVEQFILLTERLLTENEKYNLTAIRTPEKVALLHLADCALLCKHIPKGANLLDVGCGAGFPSLVVAMLRSDVKVTAMDSTERRVRYVEETARLLGLADLTAYTLRAEDGAHDPVLREHYDCVTARADADLRVLSELCLPYVKVGGLFLAMKGKNAAFELKEARRALSLLGAEHISTDDTPLFSSDLGEQSRAVLIFRKGTKTPANYPRNYSQISKKPL